MREERWEEERGDAEEDKMIETKTEVERSGEAQGEAKGEREHGRMRKTEKVKGKKGKDEVKVRFNDGH